MKIIIVPSNHTKIGAWVNSKLSGIDLSLHCTITLIALLTIINKIKTKDTISLNYNSLCYITSRVSMKGIYNKNR